MVATSVEPAAPVGGEILAAGGNAVDAAVAMGFAAGVAHQFSSGIGGGGFVVGVFANGESFALDAREVAPATARSDMYLNADGEIDKDASRLGGKAVAVPGLVQGLEAVHQRYGKLPWARVLAPAIRMCEQGVAVGSHHRRILGFARKRMEGFPETVRIQYENGEVPGLGWKLVQPDLARTLRAIQKRGSKALTEGRIANAMVKAASEHGGGLSLEDLASYPLEWREPVRGEYRGYEIVSMPPPSSGGAHLIQMLNTLEPYDLGELGVNSSEYIHLVAGAMRLAFADRAVHMGDPGFYPVPTEWLISKSYGLELSERLRAPPLYRRAPWNWGRPYVPEIETASPAPVDDAGTTHISVIDAEGNAVALTQTVNTLFGSGITVPGTGVVLNNEMNDFYAAAGQANLWGVSGTTAANAIAPRKRPLSSMTPTIVLADGKPWISLGSPMGPMIITTVLQTLLNVIDFDMNIQQAVAARRFHHQWKPDRLSLEPEHPVDVAERLQDMGHPVVMGDFRFGASTAVLYDREQGVFLGGADPRRDTAAAGPR